MKELYNTLLILALVAVGCSKKMQNAHTYIDKTTPSLQPLIFAKGFVSKDSISEFGSVFNKGNDEFYFGVDSANRAFIKYTAYQNGHWSEPVTILSDSAYSMNDPFLSNDENRLYYISDKPRDDQDTIKDHDIWYSQRKGEKWSAPINAGTAINTDGQEFYISFSENGAMYFASNKGKSEKRKHDLDIYKSDIEEGEFTTPLKLSDSINTPGYEGDVFISPDESYIIFCSARRTGFGKGDLYISFKDENDNWTQAINMGEPINSEEHELCPFVTKDGKYLFYTSNQDIYWVSTDIIDVIKEKGK